MIKLVECNSTFIQKLNNINRKFLVKNNKLAYFHYK